MYYWLFELKKGHVVFLQRWIDFGIYIDVLQKVSNFPQKQEILDLFSSVLYECVTQETPEMLPAYIAMDQVWFKNQFQFWWHLYCILINILNSEIRFPVCPFFLVSHCFSDSKKETL